MRLDEKPKFWEDRVQLFCAYLVDNGKQSSTIKSYVSAIKSILMDDGYDWIDGRILLSSIVRGCRVINDKLHYRRPLKLNLLELLLFEVDRLWDGSQPYLELLYKTLFAISYYGLMHVGEVTKSNHVLKVKDVHVGLNKEKILMVLHSSKTHAAYMQPQEIKITSNEFNKSTKFRHFCPFNLMRRYMSSRGDYSDGSEQFFIFANGMEVTTQQARQVLKRALLNINVDASQFNFHSFRIGRSTDLFQWGYSVDYCYLK